MRISDWSSDVCSSDLTMLIAPVIDEMPSRWIEKIRNGNALPVCSISGGYIVQPPAGPPPSMNSVDSIIVNANGRIQKPQLLTRGSARSEQPIIIGTSQLARPTKPGMTPPKIITSATSEERRVGKEGVSSGESRGSAKQ